jgi:hypothetical protein
MKPLLIENRIRIVALTPNLHSASFYNIIRHLYHSSTTELIPILNTYKEVLSELYDLNHT